MTTIHLDPFRTLTDADKSLLLELLAMTIEERVDDLPEVHDADSLAELDSLITIIARLDPTNPAFAITMRTELARFS